jgi:hypothetical protein
MSPGRSIISMFFCLIVKVMDVKAARSCCRLMLAARVLSDENGVSRCMSPLCRIFIVVGFSMAIP